MHPILLNLGFFKINTYGFMIATGFLLSTILFVKKATKNYNYSKIFLENLIFYIFIFGIVGGRIFYVALNYNYYSKNLIEILKVWEGGLVFFGAFIFSFLFLIYFAKKKKSDFFDITDIMSPYLALGHFFGRIGCFMAGCCYGKETHSAFGVIFKNPNSLAPINIKLHPSQLYEAFTNLILFFILSYFLKKRKFKGQVISTYLILYSALRFLLEFFRNDDRGQFLFLSTSQLISIALIFIGLILFFISKKKNNEKYNIKHNK